MNRIEELDERGQRLLDEYNGSRDSTFAILHHLMCVFHDLEHRHSKKPDQFDKEYFKAEKEFTQEASKVFRENPSEENRIEVISQRSKFAVQWYS